MELSEFLEYMSLKQPVPFGSEMQDVMNKLSDDARRITMELNNRYHSQKEIRQLFSKLTGKAIDHDFGLFPPFYTDCGKNITVGKGVFINSGCCFQDQGGITVCDGALIGHNVVLATLNHEFNPERRRNTVPAPIHIGKNVWIGSNSTVLPGVTIGDNSIIAAGAVVSKNVDENTVAGGVPARFIKSLI